MTPASWRVTALFALIELFGVGGVGALAASRYGFNYALLSPVSVLVFGLAGFFSVRAQGSGPLAAGIVACLDSLAWAAFDGVGPQPTDPNTGLAARAITVILVTAAGALVGLLGGWLSRRLRASAA